MSKEQVPYRVSRRRSRDPWTAERVVDLRTRLQLSQAAFAGRLGVRQQTVSEWETGRHAPRGASAVVLAMLAEEAGVYDSGSPGG